MRPLTPREVEVVFWASRGYTTRATASELGIGAETVKEHRASALSKLGADSMPAAVAECARRKIVEVIA